MRIPLDLGYAKNLKEIRYVKDFNLRLPCDYPKSNLLFYQV